MAGTRPPRADLRTLVRQHLAALNDGDLERLVGCYADDAVLELPASPRVEGRAAIRRAFEVFFEQWDERSTYDRIVISGTVAAVEGVTTGHHRTLHLRIPRRVSTASRPYRHSFAAFLSFHGAEIIRHRVYYDARELVQQLLG